MQGGTQVDSMKIVVVQDKPITHSRNQRQHYLARAAGRAEKLKGFQVFIGVACHADADVEALVVYQFAG